MGGLIRKVLEFNEREPLKKRIVSCRALQRDQVNITGEGRLVGSLEGSYRLK